MGWDAFNHLTPMRNKMLKFLACLGVGEKHTTQQIDSTSGCRHTSQNGHLVMMLSLPHSIYVPHMKVPEIQAGMPKDDSSLRKEVHLQGNSPVMGCHEECEFRKPGLVGPQWNNKQDLLLVLADFAQGLCEQARWGKCVFTQVPGAAVSQRKCAEGGFSQGTKQLTMCGFGKANRLSWASLKHSHISWTAPGRNLHSFRSVNCHESLSAARLSLPGI